jgi:hypothetical protein
MCVCVRVSESVNENTKITLVLIIAGKYNLKLKSDVGNMMCYYNDTNEIPVCS